MRRILTLALMATLAGCCCASGPEPRDPQPYQPRTEAEAKLFCEARRDVFPDDVRRDLQAHASETLLWSGILEGAGLSEGDRVVHIRVSHRYWDWIEDRGGLAGEGLAAVSPRGEGTYECLCECQSPEDARAFMAHLPPPGGLDITYGTPLAVTAKGVVQLRCRFRRVIGKSRFSTDLLDYGREFLLHGDPKDCRPVAVSP